MADGDEIETSYDGRRTSLGPEVVVRVDRRRRWHPSQKMAIVQESIAPGASPTLVAKRYGIATALLYTWRKQLLSAAAEGFVACEVVPETPPVFSAPAIAGPVVPSAAAAPIEVELPGGAKLRVGAGADVGALGAILAALAPK